MSILMIDEFIMASLKEYAINHPELRLGIDTTYNTGDGRESSFYITVAKPYDNYKISVNVEKVPDINWFHEKERDKEMEKYNKARIRR